MIALDLIMGHEVSDLVKAAVVQAASGYLRDGWSEVDGEMVIPVEVPQGAWLDVTVPVLGNLALGFDHGTVCLRLASAVAILARSRIPARGIEVGRDGRTTFLLDLQPGPMARIPALGIGVRWAQPVELASDGSV